MSDSSDDMEAYSGMFEEDEPDLYVEIDDLKEEVRLLKEQIKLLRKELKGHIKFGGHDDTW